MKDEMRIETKGTKGRKVREEREWNKQKKTITSPTLVEVLLVLCSLKERTILDHALQPAALEALNLEREIAQTTAIDSQDLGCDTNVCQLRRLDGGHVDFRDALVGAVNVGLDDGLFRHLCHRRLGSVEGVKHRRLHRNAADNRLDAVA